jgi:FkbM family methyltransferase
MALKKMLLSLLGEKKYLSFLAGAFPRVYRAGLLGRDYQDIYFLKKIIPPGACCVDIGAHLGYYTVELSRLAGPSGKIIAIEPIAKFHRTLERLLKTRKATNVSVLQVALGGEGDWVDMGIPKLGGIKKFAYARVKREGDNLNYVDSEKVKNETGDHLFMGLPRLDFVKCDVEGLELPVFRSMLGALSVHRPIVLCEVNDKDERVRLLEMIRPLGYEMFQLTDGRLRPLNIHSPERPISHNHYFLPGTHRERLGHLIIQPKIG